MALSAVLRTALRPCVPLPCPTGLVCATLGSCTTRYVHVAATRAPQHLLAQQRSVSTAAVCPRKPMKSHYRPANWGKLYLAAAVAVLAANTTSDPDEQEEDEQAADVGAALQAIGGQLPVPYWALANRAFSYYSNPQANPLKAIMDLHDHKGDMADVPPMLGIFNDIPRHKLRDDEVVQWAMAGFTWVVNDGEHMMYDGRYGQEQNATLLRYGITPVQRLNREAVSEHGDCFVAGARATMRPYATTLQEAQKYYKAVSFPTVGKATPHDRGGYPVRKTNREMAFTPGSLRAAERDTQGWLQFETGELILDVSRRDAVLDLMAAQGPHKACGFVGPFDAIIRDGQSPQMHDAVNALMRQGAARGIAMGRVIGSGSMTDPKKIEDAMVEAINNGARLICVHYMTSDLPYHGAKAVAEPFWNACKRTGFA